MPTCATCANCSVCCCHFRKHVCVAKASPFFGVPSATCSVDLSSVASAAVSLDQVGAGSATPTCTTPIAPSRQANWCRDGKQSNLQCLGKCCASSSFMLNSCLLLAAINYVDNYCWLLILFGHSWLLLVVDH